MFKENIKTNEITGAFRQESIEIITTTLFNEGFIKIYNCLCQGINEELWKEHDNLVFGHNDVHKGNLIRSPSSTLMLIDHEYASFNVIGFDIVNYCIESFFDLELKEYPFYALKCNIEVLFTDEKYYEIYLNYIEALIVSFPRFKVREKQLKNRKYYYSVAGLCSIFWFYSGLLFIDFESNNNKIGFDMIDYVVDRLRIYSYVYNAFESNKDLS